MITALRSQKRCCLYSTHWKELYLHLHLHNPCFTPARPLRRPVSETRRMRVASLQLAGSILVSRQTGNPGRDTRREVSWPAVRRNSDSSWF